LSAPQTSSGAFPEHIFFCFRIEPDKRQAFEDADRRLIEAGGGSVHFSAAIVLVTAVRSRELHTPRA
jgi:hypothetical protein